MLWCCVVSGLSCILGEYVVLCCRWAKLYFRYVVLLCCRWVKLCLRCACCVVGEPSCILGVYVAVL